MDAPTSSAHLTIKNHYVWINLNDNFQYSFFTKALFYLANTITKASHTSVHYTNTIDIDFFYYIEITVIKCYNILIFKRQNVNMKIIKIKF